MRSDRRAALFTAAVLALGAAAGPELRAAPTQSPPESERGRIDAERSGQHDAARIRTVFWNFGMVGDYDLNTDLTVFHSAEVPKGTGMNYTDGITPFVLAKIRQLDGSEAYIMETGFRERQGTSPANNRIMRFEPRPGYFQDDPNVNEARSPAISSDPRTWPEEWPDKLNDPEDPGWPGSWNGYFGKRAVADQESFMVMDDNFYDAWLFNPDSTDLTRRGLGLRIEVRGFQWANPQAANVIFWHYDIVNEGTTAYNDSIIFGLYMDSGVGGSGLSCDGFYESDDDNASFDRSTGLNLVYTWDSYGRGVDLAGSCSRTGYLGYAYLETPGNQFDGLDNDQDGVTDERREGGSGQRIVGQPEIRAYVMANYDLARFEATYGPLEGRPAYRFALWWTGDEDLDWSEELDDVGADGVPDTQDLGEGDGEPTDGESNFDRTDLNESDQVGLTGFKMNRIRVGEGNPSTEVDGIVFFTNADNWPQRLYEKFTHPSVPERFDPPVAYNYNIGFLFASGPFRLLPGKRERFSLALAYGTDLNNLRENVRTVQQIYDANYRFAVPPPMPTVTAEAGDGFVRLSWTDDSERGLDPVTGLFDFEGYRIYRSTDPEFRDPQTISTGTGSGPQPGNGAPIAQFDLIDGKRGFSERTIEGVAYWLGSDSGLTHTWIDTTVTNGQEYFYAVTAYDYGFEPGGDSLGFYPSENAIAVSRTPRGGTILPQNVVVVRPNPRVPGFVSASAETASHVVGNGTGSVRVEVVNSNLVPEGHLFAVQFAAPSPDSVRASTYSLRDSTFHELLFESGSDLGGMGTGPVGSGLLPIPDTPLETTIDTTRTGFAPGSPTDAVLAARYIGVLPRNWRRGGYPEDMSIIFSDAFEDTGQAIPPYLPRRAKFIVVAHTDSGDVRLDFRFRDSNGDGTLSAVADTERIEIVTQAPVRADSQLTWRVEIPKVRPTRPPAAGDVYTIRLAKPIGDGEIFTFSTRGQRVDPQAAAAAWNANEPYAVPNPYVGSASFEPARFAISGRGERRMEFRQIPQNATVRIYTVRGELVQTLRQEGNTEGFVAWNLRTKDNLDVAPGLYVFHVEAGDAEPFIGKFAVVK